MVVPGLESQYARQCQAFDVHQLYAADIRDHQMFRPILLLADALYASSVAPLVIVKGVIKPEPGQVRRRRVSTHVFRCAIDFGVNQPRDLPALAQRALSAAASLDLKIRLGWKLNYRKRTPILHADTAPMLAEAAFQHKLIPASVYRAWSLDGHVW